MRKKKTDEFTYVTEQMDVNIESIYRFKPIGTLRSIRSSQVERLEKAFLDGSYVSATPIHVNSKKGHFNVIDGNHRIVAVKNLLESGKIKKTKLTLAVYQNLSQQEERDLYDLIAKQVPQNINDFISLHRVEFPLWNLIEKKSFPCKITIYGSKDSLQFKHFLYMLNCIKRKKFLPGVKWMDRDKILSTGRKTGIADYNVLARFARIFMAAYGAPGTDNKYSKLHMIMPLFHIWHTNKKDRVSKGKNKTAGTHKDDVKWAGLFEKIMSDPEIVLYLNAVMNRETLPRIRQRMIELMQPFRNSKNTKHRLK